MELRLNERIQNRRLPINTKFLYRLSKIVVTVICLSLHPSLTRAQIEVDTKHNYTYGQSATFNLEVGDTSAYENYTLFISATDMRVSSHKVKPANNSITFERDLRDKPIPPFSYVTYWWEFTDDSQSLITTEKTTFQYTDNRYSWQSYIDGDIRIFWVNGDKSTMVNAATIIRETINEVQHGIQSALLPVVDVYVYPSALDLQSALQLAGYEWVAGAAYPELGVILLSVTEGKQALSQMQRILPHELTHKILFDVYGPEGYKNIPVWLEEGLATYFEPVPDPEYTLALVDANTNGTLLRFELLCHPFVGDLNTRILSYAQSESMTQYILQTYGWSRVRILLENYANEGVACITGLEQALDAQTIQIERDWRVWLQTEGNPNTADPSRSIFKLSPEIQAAITIFVKDASRWLVLCLILVLPLLIFSFQSAIKKRTPR